jgi:hypothetical protein
MIIGTAVSSGGWNAMVGSRTNVNTVLFGAICARWLEQMPRNSPSPPRAGTRSTPVVMLQTSGLTSGEEEME